MYQDLSGRNEPNQLHFYKWSDVDININISLWTTYFIQIQK